MKNKKGRPLTPKCIELVTKRYPLPDLPVIDPWYINVRKYLYTDEKGNYLSGIFVLSHTHGYTIRTILNGETHSYDDLPSYRSVAVNLPSNKTIEDYIWHRKGLRHRFQGDTIENYHSDVLVRTARYFFDNLVTNESEEIYMNKGFLDWIKISGIDRNNLSEEDKLLMHFKWDRTRHTL